MPSCAQQHKLQKTSVLVGTIVAIGLDELLIIKNMLRFLYYLSRHGHCQRVTTHSLWNVISRAGPWTSRAVAVLAHCPHLANNKAAK